MNLLEELSPLLEHDLARSAVRALAIMVVGYLAMRIIRRKLDSGSMRPQQRYVIARLLGAIIFGVCITWALSELGVDMGVLLGAAGVLTVAVGFAAQTAVSNLISGLFLVAERPFQIDDLISVGTTTGRVIAIDLMSTKLRTLDNLYVRIPNETLLKAEVTNLTHFPIRRYDMLIGVGYGEDVARVREALFQVAEKNPLCLVDPEPLLIFLGFGASSLDLQFSIWSTTGNFLAMRNSMHEEVKRELDARGIEIPFPQRTLTAGSDGKPIPIKLVGESVRQQT